MQIKRTVLIFAAAFSLSACAILAQGGGPRPPAMPVVTALDANGDGTISAEEMADAPAALKTLDANGDGKLTRDEFMPPPPSGQNRSGAPSGERPVPAN